MACLHCIHVSRIWNRKATVSRRWLVSGNWEELRPVIEMKFNSTNDIFWCQENRKLLVWYCLCLSRRSHLIQWNICAVADRTNISLAIQCFDIRAFNLRSPGIACVMDWCKIYDFTIGHNVFENEKSERRKKTNHFSFYWVEIAYALINHFVFVVAELQSFNLFHFELNVRVVAVQRT